MSSVTRVSPYVATEAMLKGDKVASVLLTGIIPNYEEHVTKVSKKMKEGNLLDLSKNQYNIVVGSKLLEKLDKNLGDIITVLIPNFNQGTVGFSAKVKKFTIVGVFNIGSYEYDSKLAFIHLSDAQSINNIENGIQGMRIETNNMMNASKIANEIRNEIGDFLRIRDWTQENSNFFTITNKE